MYKRAELVRAVQEDAAAYLASGGVDASPLLKAIFAAKPVDMDLTESEIAGLLLEPAQNSQQ